MSELVKSNIDVLMAQEEKVEGFLQPFGSAELFLDWCRMTGVKGIPNDSGQCLVARAIYTATGVTVTVDKAEDDDDGEEYWQYNLHLGNGSQSQWLPEWLQEVPQRFDDAEYPEFFYPRTD